MRVYDEIGTVPHWVFVSAFMVLVDMDGCSSCVFLFW